MILNFNVCPPQRILSDCMQGTFARARTRLGQACATIGYPVYKLSDNGGEFPVLSAIKLSDFAIPGRSARG